MAAVQTGGLTAFNSMSDSEVEQTLIGICASRRWAAQIRSGRPYSSRASLLASADEAVAELTGSDLKEALSGHPRIGERLAGNGHEVSRGEQSGVDSASDATRDALVEGNRAYEDRFGHVYLVFATGKTAEEMLAILRSRIDNDPDREWEVTREELAKINRRRLEQLVGA